MPKGLSLVSAFLLLGACSSGHRNVGLAPDLHFWLDCREQLGEADQIAIEEGLFAAGFNVLNTARAAKEQQVEYPYRVKIEALDEDGRVVSLRGFEPGSRFAGRGDRPFATSVSVFTEPPTRRDDRLEKAVLSIMASNVACSVRDVQRNSNDVASKAIYRRTVKRTEGWFEQARAMGSSSAVRVH